MKPVASRRKLLLLAAMTWAVVGLVLGTTGARWLLTLHASSPALLIGAAVAAGVIKSHLALRPAARRVIRRIEERGEGRCAGGFFSWSTWLLVLAMIALGQLLRHSPMPRWALGAIYLAVGVALITASRHLWIAWRAMAATAPSDSG
jgi:hypothetical protein